MDSKRTRLRGKGVGETDEVSLERKPVPLKAGRKKPWVSWERAEQFCRGARRERIRQIEAKALERMRTHGLVKKLEGY